MMSPAEVSEYVKALRDLKVVSGRLVLAGDEINVVFAPDMSDMPGDVPTAGGWKGPDRLDDHSVFELDPTPPVAP